MAINIETKFSDTFKIVYYAVTMDSKLIAFFLDKKDAEEYKQFREGK